MQAMVEQCGRRVKMILTRSATRIHQWIVRIAGIHWVEYPHKLHDGRNSQQSDLVHRYSGMKVFNGGTTLAVFSALLVTRTVVRVSASLDARLGVGSTR